MQWGAIRLVLVKWADDAADLDLIDQWIQERYAVILDAHPWKALEVGSTIATTPGAAGVRALYPLPVNLKILLEVNNAVNNFPMRPYTQAELDLVYPGRVDVAGVGGAPNTFIYSMAEDTPATPPLHQVELYPIPSAAQNHPIRYTSIPATFDPQQTTQSPLPWIPAHTIIRGVRADICAEKKDYAGMEAFEKLFASGINELLRLEIHRQPNSRVSELQRYDASAIFPPPPK
jgi:hypothetical protein